MGMLLVMLTPLAFVRLCYRLDESARYREFKRATYDLLENPHSRQRPYFDVGMILLVLASVFVLLYEVKHHLGNWAQWFEWFAVGVFLLEYLLRMWLFSDARRIVIEQFERAELVNAPFYLRGALADVVLSKWRYVSSPLAIVDLLAILPTYRPLRFLRLFLLFRLFKVFRYARSISQFVGVLAEKKVEFYTLFTFLAFLLVVAASAIYLFESPREGGEVENFFQAIYWALVTLSTVGYGDITPQTAEGRLVTMILILGGIGVLSFFTSIVVSAFNEKLPEIHNNRVFAELERHPGHIILCGFGRIGADVGGRLARDRERFVVVDHDPDRVALAKRLGYLAVHGRVEEIDLLRLLGVHNGASSILCLTGDDVINVYVTLSARQLNRDIRIVSRANREDSLPKLYQAGANDAVMPFRIAGLIAAEYTGQPVAFEAIQGILMGDADIALETLHAHSGGPLDGMRIGDLPLREYRLILFGVITPLQRDSDQARTHFVMNSNRFHFNPGGDFQLQSQDVLVVFGHRLSFVRFRERYGRRGA